SYFSTVLSVHATPAADCPLAGAFSLGDPRCIYERFSEIIGSKEAKYLFIYYVSSKKSILYAQSPDGCSPSAPLRSRWDYRSGVFAPLSPPQGENKNKKNI